MVQILSGNLQVIALLDVDFLQIKTRYLLGPKSPTPQTQQLFGHPFDQHLDLKHSLIQLAALIDWAEIEKTFSGYISIFLSTSSFCSKV